MKISEPIRPDIKDYGIPEDKTGMLNWNFVDTKMKESKNYWVATTRSNGRPHTTPVWGVWLENIFYFGGGSETQRAKNLGKNPYAVVHTESGDEVVIIEGITDIIYQSDENKQLMDQIIAIYKEKYKMDHPPPFWQIIPNKVFAWKEYPTSLTKWIIENS